LPKEIGKAVGAWRRGGYEGVTPTTERLLQYWFYEDHLTADGQPFCFWDCQREAIETLIYLYEVCQYRSMYQLCREFGVDVPFKPSEDNWPSYCFKMATGAGKTFVMGMAIVWQYFNALRGEPGDSDYTSKFLLIAPNLIVLDRLLEGFDDGGIFREFPFFIPEEWQSQFDLQIVQQTDDAPAHSAAVLHVTNVQQFYERERGIPENPVQELLGPRPVQGEEFLSRVHLKEIMSHYDRVMVLNDEAHHAHIETEWNQALKDINGDTDRVSLQLDFTATAWDIARGQQVPLPHIVYDYPLKRAIDDRIVKDPHLAILTNTPPPTSDEFVEQHQTEIHTAIEYLRKRKKDLAEVGKKPVLFVVCDDTDHANEVAEYIREQLGYGAKVLLIHTYVRGSRYGGIGDVRQDELEYVRQAAREIDENEYEVIVSVLMLKEGWDVRNVSVILPMRAFGSDILVEQTLGRGLRRMFPYDDDADDRLYVIEHPSFRHLWEEKIEAGDYSITIEAAETAYQEPTWVRVDPDKLTYDFSIPMLLGGMTKRVPDIDKLDITKLPSQMIALEDIEVLRPTVIEQRLRDRQVVRTWVPDFNFTPMPEEYFAYLTKSILRRAGSSAQFAQLFPKVRDYVSKYFFTEPLEQIDEDTMKRLNTPQVRGRVGAAFVDALQDLSVVQKEYKVSEEYALSETKPFPTTSPVYPAHKSVFNCLPYSETTTLEGNFMRYLDEQEDVLAFTKVLRRIPLRISYYDPEKGVQRYVPDFIVKTANCFYLIETKGEVWDQLPNVKQKDKAATAWCTNASEISDIPWEYRKVRQDVFEQNWGSSFNNMMAVCEELNYT